jgi:hypothetical protein
MSSDAPAPKTRKEKKKDQKTKGDGKNGKYSAKHARGLIMPIVKIEKLEGLEK